MLTQLKKLIPNRSALRLIWHRAKAFLAALRQGFPARSLTIIGITGTDGKTTTVSMTAHILAKAGKNVGALSTAFFRVNDDMTWNATQKTSPSPMVVQSFLQRLVRASCTHAVIEYSSHGLVQGRTYFTWPKVAAITNTSPEHLDYHGTMEQYREDKGILFCMLRGKGTKVLNRSDETYQMYTRIPSAQTIVYSSKLFEPRPEEIGLWITNVSETSLASTALLHVWRQGRESSQELSLPLPGLFNLENALCAIASSMAVGVAVESAVKALASFQGVPGRMERIDEGQPFSVFVDFTVTPASYRTTLSALRRLLNPGNRLLVLTGSCGDRMKEKRPQVGRICSEEADIVVVSNEDPYTEDPEKIIDEVWAGVDQSKTEAHRISDRGSAIKFLLEQAKPGDIVALCGKGSDTTMWTRHGQVLWNEREMVRKMLRVLR